MTRYNHTCRAIVWLLMAAPAAGPAAAAEPARAVARIDRGMQQTASIQDRLKRVQDGLFAGTAKPDQAIRELKAILAVEPGSAEAHLLLGIAYRSAGSSDLMGEAVAELRQALALNPGFVPAHFYLAHIYLDLGRAERARDELQTGLSQSPGNPQFMALLGEAERQLKNPARSVELNREALKLDASSGESRYYLGLALFDLGKRDEAIAELERVVQAAPNVVDPYLSLGTAYVEARRFDDALNVLRQGVRIDPARPELRIQMARAYRSKGLLDSADAQLRLAQPKGSALAASMFQHQQIEFDLYLEQGMLRMQRGQLEPAAAAFRKVLEMDPNHGPTNRYLAEVYRQQGAYARAAEHAARAEKAGSPLPEDKRRALEKHRKDAGGRE
jgi:cytochrome c-type biogenesis protein CcmH/NrfG